jgi:hypothetical protein
MTRRNDDYVPPTRRYSVDDDSVAEDDPRLRRCPDCDRRVSVRAYECPNCGSPLRSPERDRAGQILKWAFIVWNVAMFVWLVLGITHASKVGRAVDEDSAKAGAAIGTGIGVCFIMTIWGLGTAVLGALVYFTRAKRE